MYYDKKAAKYAHFASYIHMFAALCALEAQINTLIIIKWLE